MSECGTHSAYVAGCRCEKCRAAKAAYQKSYRDARPGEQAVYLRQWRKKNPDKVAAYQSRRTHRVKPTPEKQREYSRRWYEKNAEACRERQREWTRTHPEQSAAYSRARLARKREAPGSHTVADVQMQKARQKNRCFWCKQPLHKFSSYHVDHVVPLIKGGSDGPENIVIACPPCNQHKQAIHPMDFAGVML